MRRLAYVPFAVAAAACAPPAASGPVTAPANADPPPPASAILEPPVQPCARRTVHVVRHEKTGTVAACQVAPVDLASDVTAEITHAREGRLALHVLKDDESAENLPAPPSLAGKTYPLQVEAGSVTAATGSDAGIDPEEARRVVALGSLAVKWTNDVGRGLREVADMEVRGARPQVTVTVEPGSGPRYSVRLDATQSDAGMCHHWSTTAHLQGDLTLRDDGTVESLRLRGPETTTEALCAEGARQSGASAAPRECTRGEITLAIDTSCGHP